MKIFGAILETMEILIFLCELPLILGVGRKRKNMLKIFVRDPRYRIERDWPVGFGATLGDGQKIKNSFSSFRDFSGDSR